MKIDSYLTIAYILIGLAVGLGIGFIYASESQEETICPSCNITCPNVVIPECPAIKDCTPIYNECVDPDTAEEDAELYENETGKKVFEAKSSRTCKNFLENSYLRPDKEVISYSNVDDGCLYFYVLK